MNIILPLCAAAMLMAGAAPGLAQSDDSTDLAKKLSNPVADLVSVPFQYNYNQGFADGDGNQSYVNIQPVIPISISPDWNVVSRTILPVIWQDDVVPGKGAQSGFGSITQSFFFSPKAPTQAGLIWGAGPVVLVPVATDDLSTNQWAAGPTAVALAQKNQWTYGALANHLWSFTGNDSDGEINQTFLQPFLSYTTPSATSYGINSESTYDWEAEQWSVPLNFFVGQVVKIGRQPVQLQAGVRYWAQSPDGGPDDWGARAAVTFMFPK